MSSTTAQNPSTAAELPPAITISENFVLQPPLPQTAGPTAGIVMFLPSPDRIGFDPISTTPSDPDPPIKWAQDGFAVLAATDYDGLVATETLKKALDLLQNLDNLKVKDRFVVIVYEPKLIRLVSDAASKDPRVACFVGYGSFASPSLTIPIALHLTANAPRPADPPSDATTIFTYFTTSPFFVLPRSAHYDVKSATHADSRTLQFIRHQLPMR